MDEQVESLTSILGKGVEPASPAVVPQEPVKTVETQPEPVAAPETKAEKPRDESGRFAKPEEKEPEKEVDGRTQALRAERERRRQLEQRIKELEVTKAQEPKVSIFEDEDKGISQRVDDRVKPVMAAHFNMSVKLAKLTYKDEFDRAETAFVELAEQDPRLYQQLRAAEDPGDFIYTVGTQYAELGPVGGDFMKYREKVTGELKGELSKKDEHIKALEAKLQQFEKSQKELAAVPTSLNSVQSSASPKVIDVDAEDIKTLVRFGNKRA
jgi:uncharacterized coiled-coil protein SlyX